MSNWKAVDHLEGVSQCSGCGERWCDDCGVHWADCDCGIQGPGVWMCFECDHLQEYAGACERCEGVTQAA